MTTKVPATMTVENVTSATVAASVTLTGNQTIAGTKTFSSGVVLGSSTLNPSGSAPAFACRAWCSFNGTTAGTNAPSVGGNVTSVTRNGAGDYTITFTTAMASATYGVVTTTDSGAVVRTSTLATETVRVLAYNTSFAAADPTYVTVAVFA